MSINKDQFTLSIRQGIPDTLPPAQERDFSVSHAPNRNLEGVLTPEERKLAINNALRYFPPKWHSILAVEFAHELDQYGRIYM